MTFDFDFSHAHARRDENDGDRADDENDGDRNETFSFIMTTMEHTTTILRSHLPLEKQIPLKRFAFLQKKCQFHLPSNDGAQHAETR